MDFELSKPSNLTMYGLDYTCFKLGSCNNNVIVKDDSDIPVLKIFLDFFFFRYGP